MSLMQVMQEGTVTGEPLTSSQNLSVTTASSPGINVMVDEKAG